MTRDFQKEDEFYKKDFKFSYSSLNKLLFSPSLFYKDYILLDREEKTEKYLIEGKLVHLLLFEPDQFDKTFNLVPGKTPSDSVIKVLKDMSMHTDAETLVDCDDWVILDSLKQLNLYQSLKLDEARVAKIRTDDAKEYWSFMNKSNLDIIDQTTLEKCKKYVEVIKANPDVMALFHNPGSDFELDPVKTYAEKKLDCSLEELPFGLKGIIDFYKVDSDKKEITIVDLKTTGKTISDFRETVDFYKYWLQAAVYIKLVLENASKEEQDYDIIFKFVVIDKYNQVYVFDVSDQTLGQWAEGFKEVISQATYHYKNRDYSLPYEFLVNKVKL